MTVSDLTSNGSSPHWHSIRPWSPRFLLTVREVTSVSATFILSSTLSSTAHGEPSLSSLGITSGSDDEDSLEDVPLVSDALTRGLSVNVNGATWKRVLVRMDEDGDEAVIILYGLMPGRQYDIELGIPSVEGEEIVHSRMVTQPQPHTPDDDHKKTVAPDHSASASVVNESEFISSNGTASRFISQDEYAAQLLHQLSALNAERDSLTIRVKAARKESQKAEATLRTEIEALKRANDKNATAEQRGRQKVLALQEAVKQALAATKETEALVAQLEASLPELRERENEAQEQHAVAVKEEECSKADADEVVRADKKRTGDLQSELGTLTNRLERLSTKRDKLTAETIPELEEQLAKLIREVELVERNADTFEVVDNGPVGFNLGSRAIGGRSAGQLSPIGSQRHTLISGSRQSPFEWNTSPGMTLSSTAPPFEPSIGFRHGRGQGHNFSPSHQNFHHTSPAASLRPAFPISSKDATASAAGTSLVAHSSTSSSSSSPTPTSSSTSMSASASGDNSPSLYGAHNSFMPASGFSAAIGSGLSRSQSQSAAHQKALLAHSGFHSHFPQQRHHHQNIAPGPSMALNSSITNPISNYPFDPPINSTQLALSHTQAWDAPQTSGSAVVGATVPEDNRRPLSPVRQASLPLRMPSTYASASAQGLGNR